MALTNPTASATTATAAEQVVADAGPPPALVREPSYRSADEESDADSVATEPQNRTDVIRPGQPAGKRKADDEDLQPFCGVCRGPFSPEKAMACDICCNITCSPCCEQLRSSGCPYCRAERKLIDAAKLFEDLSSKRIRLKRNLNMADAPPYCSTFLSRDDLEQLIKKAAHSQLFHTQSASYHNMVQLLPTLLKFIGCSDKVIRDAYDVRRYCATFHCEACQKSGKLTGEPPRYFVGGTCLCETHHRKCEDSIRQKLEACPDAMGFEPRTNFSEDIIKKSGATQVVLGDVALDLKPERVIASHWHQMDGGTGTCVQVLEDDHQVHASATTEGLLHALTKAKSIHDCIRSGSPDGHWKFIPRGRSPSPLPHFNTYSPRDYIGRWRSVTPRSWTPPPPP